MTKKIANTQLDPTLPKTPIEINGKTYNMCLDLGALAEAESALIAQGYADVNLLYALPIMNLSNTRLVFAASLRKFHPEISFEDAQKLLTFESLWNAAEKIRDAWASSIPSDPLQPGE